MAPFKVKVEQRSPPLRARSHHNWGARLGRRRRDEIKQREPTLSQLEEHAQMSSTLMEKYGPKSKHNFYVAMDLLRQQYNMNFIMICGKCNGSHMYDEITAPER